MMEDTRHDSAGLAPARAGQSRPDYAEHAFEIDLESMVPARVGQLGERHLVGDAG
jgi:hypothetical protein